VYAQGRRDAERAIDLTAETFAKAFEKREQFHGDTDVEAPSVAVRHRARRDGPLSPPSKSRWHENAQPYARPFPHASPSDLTAVV